MQVTTTQVLGTVLATGVVGFLVWLVTVPLRLRSVTGLIGSVVVTGPLAVLGGIGWALLLGPRVDGPGAALLLAVIAVGVAAVESGLAATRAYRRFTRASGALRATLGSMADGSVPDLTAERPLLAELDQVRSELSDVARELAAARERDHALDRSRRQLIAWVSHDLQAPLTVLRAMSERAASDDELRSEVSRLVPVVDDLFDLATAAEPGSAATTVPTAQPAQLSDVIAAAVATLDPLVRLHDVAVRVTGLTSVPVRAVGPDGDDLSRRLLALLVEAVRVSAPGSTCHVAVAADLADPDAVRLVVHPGATVAASPPGALLARRA